MQMIENQMRLQVCRNTILEFKMTLTNCRNDLTKQEIQQWEMQSVVVQVKGEKQPVRNQSYGKR